VTEYAGAADRSDDLTLLAVRRERVA